MGSVYFDSQLKDEERRDRLYAGDIFVMSPTARTRTLIDFARQMLEEAFAPHDPRTIHEHKTPEEVAAILGNEVLPLIHHPFCKKIVPQIMEEHGLDVEKLYFDVPRLRTSTSDNYLTTGIAYAFHPHRDTWYSAPMMQLNWWLPIYDVTPGQRRSPSTRSTSTGASPTAASGYNYYEWNRDSRAIAARRSASDTRDQPKPGGASTSTRRSGRCRRRRGDGVLRRPSCTHRCPNTSGSGPVQRRLPHRALRRRPRAPGRPEHRRLALPPRTSIRDFLRARISLPFPRRRWHCTMTTPPRVTGCSTSATSS